MKLWILIPGAQTLVLPFPPQEASVPLGASVPHHAEPELVLNIFFFFSFSSSFSQIGSHPRMTLNLFHVSKDDSELRLLLSPSPECWDYRFAPPLQVCFGGKQTWGFVNAKRLLGFLNSEKSHLQL